MINLKAFFSSFESKPGTVSKKYISKYLPKNPVIIEAGAHIGLDTYEMAKMWPGAKIFAFEPIPELFQKLVKTTSSFPNVKCFQMALGDETGFCNINLSSGASDGSSSLLEPKEHIVHHPEVFFQNQLEVEVITLHDWMMKNEVEKIDFFGWICKDLN